MRRVTDGSTVLQVKFSKVRIKWFAKVGRSAHNIQGTEVRLG